MAGSINRSIKGAVRPVKQVSSNEPLIVSNTGSAAAQLQVSLPASVGRITCLKNAVITSAAVAAVVSGVVTISDGTFTLNYQFVETVSAGGYMCLDFAEPLPASAANTAITVTIPAITGGAVTAIALVGHLEN